MTDAVGGMDVRPVAPTGAARPVVEALRFGLVAAALFAAQDVVWLTLFQGGGPGGLIWLTTLNAMSVVVTVGLLVLAFVAGRRGSTAGLVGIGLVVAGWYAWWTVVPHLSELGL